MLQAKGDKDRVVPVEAEVDIQEQDRHAAVGAACCPVQGAELPRLLLKVAPNLGQPF